MVVQWISAQFSAFAHATGKGSFAYQTPMLVAATLEPTEVSIAVVAK